MMAVGRSASPPPQRSRSAPDPVRTASETPRCPCARPPLDHGRQTVHCGACRADVHPVSHHRMADQFRDAGRGGPAAKKQDALIGELLPCDAQGGKNARERDASCWMSSLNAADLVTIALEDRNGVDVGKVLPLNAASRIRLLHRCSRIRRRRPHIRRRARVHWRRPNRADPRAAD